MPQVMEGEIVNQFPLALGGTSLERPEPVMNPLFRQALAALRRKDVGPISISTRFEILVERLAKYFPPSSPCLLFHIEALWKRLSYNEEGSPATCFREAVP